MQGITPTLGTTWKEVLRTELASDYFINLMNFIREERKLFDIYPDENFLFEAFNRCPFDKTRVVIIGQDPYHGTGQAHGLSFSVQQGCKIPPSLRNIFKEIQNEYATAPPGSGDLSHWADQGVLLLNAILSVRASKPGSHRKKGWETFTDACISALSAKQQHLVFMFWGRFAQKKAALIDQSKHLVLETSHPSPLSASKGFFGCNHFLQCNEYLQSHNKSTIHWAK